MSAGFSLTRELYFQIRDRAMRFAQTQKWQTNFVVLRIGPANDEEIQRFGTSGSNFYCAALIRMELTAERRAWLLSQMYPLNDPAEYERFLAQPMDLRVVCTPTDVLDADWPSIDFD